MNDITQEIFGNQLYTVGKKSDTSKQVFTPTKVVDDMIDLLPAEIFNPDTTFIDIYCKSGIFLKRIYEKLDLALQKLEKFTNPEIRRNHILNNQIYGLVMDNSASLLLCNKVIYGDAFHDGHLLYLDSVNVAGYSNYEDILHKMSPTKIKETIEKMFNRQGLGFDVVVGNPPYNRGGDIDFVNLGYELCNKYTVMITPAKWQTAEANQRIDSQMSYGDFRKKIVPHMKEVVYYPQSMNVFDIYQIDGISYYLIDKLNTYENCKIHNICKEQILFNQTVKRQIRNCETLYNCGYKIVEKLKNYNRFKFNVNHQGKFVVRTNFQISGSGSRLMQNDGTQTIIGLSRINDRQTDDVLQYMFKSQSIIYQQNSYDNCISFLSWLNTKLIRFLVQLNVSKLGPILTNHYFRFVPEIPNGLNMLYTDEFMYNFYNLDSDEIKTIESVIRSKEMLTDEIQIKGYKNLGFGYTIGDLDKAYEYLISFETDLSNIEVPKLLKISDILLEFRKIYIASDSLSFARQNEISLNNGKNSYNFRILLLDRYTKPCKKYTIGEWVENSEESLESLRNKVENNKEPLDIKDLVRILITSIQAIIAIELLNKYRWDENKLYKTISLLEFKYRDIETIQEQLC